MLTVDEALAKVLEWSRPLGVESVSLEQACGRVLAEALFARTDLPAFTNSAMDGYAVRAADLAGASRDRPVPLKIGGLLAAGAAALPPVRPGEAVKIMTGAPLPPGGDAVVMKEAARETDAAVLIFHRPEPGEFMRLRGEDVRTGEFLLKAGTRLRPYEISLLAAQGIDPVPVFQRPRAAIVTTGDEIASGVLRDSNGPALAACLSAEADIAFRGRAGDDPAALEAVLREALAAADVLVISGGVSAGEFDFTGKALARLGFREIFWKVAMKPGMPLLFGECAEKLVFGLPGNPLSALVCAEEFVLPALRRMQGWDESIPRYPLQGRVLNDFPKPLNKQQFLFCRATTAPDGYRLHLLHPQGSAMMKRASEANALAVAPVGVERVRAGDTLPFRWLA
jgi:molybdopterin molybdotransferase